MKGQRADGYLRGVVAQSSGEPLPFRAGVPQRQRRVLHVAKGESVRPVGDQHDFRSLGLAGVHAENAGPGGDESSPDPVGDKLAENGIGCQGAVLPDFPGQGAGIGRQRLEAFGELGVGGALGLYLLLHQGGFFSGGTFLNLGQLEPVGQLLFLGQGCLIALRKLCELLPQDGGQIRLFLNLRLRCRELLPGHRGFGGTALQFLVERLDAGLRRGVLLLKVGLFLLQLFLLLPGGFADPGQLRLQLFAVLLLLAERLLHDRRKIFPAGVPRLGQDIHLDGRRRAFVLAGHLAEVRRERQQAQQQKVADDNENAAVHDDVTGVGVVAGVAVPAASASDSSTNRRRAGRRLKILNTHTKMMPNDVDE